MVFCQQGQKTYYELITEPITLGPKDNKVIEHSQLPLVKDELSVTLRIYLASHGLDWTSVFHKGGFQ
ncbi:9879_t:CDS:1, partial [Funneliformis caledonium]